MLRTVKFSMQHVRFAAVVSGILGVTVITGAEGAEHRVKRSDLPAAVQRTVDTESTGAVVRGLSMETANGKTNYEAELVVNGHSKDVLIDADGKILEVEEEIALGSLPVGISEALEAQANGGKITRVESVTKNGSLFAYEAQARAGLKRSEIQVGPNGEPR